MGNVNKIFTIITLCLCMCSCNDDFLDKYPKDELSSETFWTDRKDAEAGLIATYDALAAIKHTNPERGCATWATFGLLDLITPIGNERQNRLRPIADGIHTGTTSSVMQTWRHGYRGVVRANDFLTHIDAIEFAGENAEETKNIMKGEAMFLRALNYYWLVELFGDVPLFTHVPTVDDATTARAPKAEVLNLIKSDLEFAINHLPDADDTEIGRASKGAALALRVKTALYEKDWSTAADVSALIMDLEYNLVPDYGDVININNENNEEIIFSVQHVFMNDAEPGNYAEKLYANSSCASSGWSFLQPTLWFVDQFQRIIEHPKEGIDYVNDGGLNSDGEPKIPNKIYEYFEGRDPRMDYTILRPGSHFIDLNDKDLIYPHEIIGPNHTLTGMHMRKYVIPGSGTSMPWDGPLDFIIFRYADILLCHLEAVAMRDGVMSITQEVLDKTINRVRDRASNLLPKYKVGKITMDDIYRERICELGFEGWTYFDMKRSGMIELNNGYEVKGLKVTPDVTIDFNPEPVNNIRIFDPATHYVFPIPTDEIERSNYTLTQNPGYPQ